MTIAAAYLTSEGVVLGADSTTTITAQNSAGKGSVLQLFNFSQKVFEVGSGSQLGICTWGDGIVGQISHRTIAARLGRWIADQETPTVKMAVDRLVVIVEELIKAGQSIHGTLGYYLGGWCTQDDIPACFRIVFEPSGASTISRLGIGEANFSGAPKFFMRVFRGFDQELPVLLRSKLGEKLAIPATELDAAFNAAFKEAVPPLAAIGARDMPIREAIDYIYSYLHITIKAHKFQFGVPICGGPIEIGFITSDRPFRWVRHKSFDAAIKGQEAEYDK
jgi:hypothetical protein